MSDAIIGDARIIELLESIDGRLSELVEHSHAQTETNRGMAEFTKMLTGTAVVDEPEVRPPFADYRENEAGDGWDVYLKFANQPADWYPATYAEVQQIAERNARRNTKRGR